jgi:16S rRNA G1207 methylase RsmC
MSIPKSHYFQARPEVPSQPRTVHLRLPDLELSLATDRGVFGAKAIDLGTMVLLREAPGPPAQGEILDLGCGYGPIALTLARRAAAAHVWAVDVNERAVDLTRANAVAAGTPNVTAATPAEVQADLLFDAI